VPERARLAEVGEVDVVGVALEDRVQERTRGVGTMVVDRDTFTFRR
jgi:hypothetical protein